MKKVSVIIPIYMIQDYLPKCIESVLEQSYQNLEIILVDDGSKDGCGIIVDEYERKDKRIKAIHKENGGLVSARKTGIRLATGEYVVYVDGDDWIDPDYIESLVTTIEREDADVVTSGYMNEVRKHFDMIPTGIYHTSEERTLLYQNMVSIGDFYNFGIRPFLWGKIYRRRLLTAFQLNVDETICVGEDVACLYPMLLEAKKVVVSGICGYHYRTREGSMTSQTSGLPDESELHLANRYDFLKQIFSHYDQNFKLQEQLDQYIYFALLMKFPGKLFSEDGEEYMPFHLKRGKRIALYGMGRFGTGICEAFREKNFCDVLCQTDKFAYQIDGAVQASKLCECNYDEVLIATYQELFIREIRNWLVAMGVSRDKISEIDFSDDACKTIVKTWREKAE